MVYDESLKRGVDIAQGKLRVGGDCLLIGRRIERALKAQAKTRAAMQMVYCADILGVSVPSLSLVDTKTRWGSCSSRGAIRLNWRLVMAPTMVFDYVVAHEMAHLREMNHSKAFWAEVLRCDPKWEEHRKWLKSEGSRLQQYDFSRLG